MDLKSAGALREAQRRNKSTISRPQVAAQKNIILLNPEKKWKIWAKSDTNIVFREKCPNRFCEFYHPEIYFNGAGMEKFPRDCGSTES